MCSENREKVFQNGNLGECSALPCINSLVAVVAYRVQVGESQCNCQPNDERENDVMQQCPRKNFFERNCPIKINIVRIRRYPSQTCHLIYAPIKAYITNSCHVKNALSKEP